MAKKDNAIFLQVGGREVRLSNPDKVFFPDMFEEKSIRGADLNSPLEYKFSAKGLQGARASALVSASVFSPEDLAFIRSELDHDVVEKVGYADVLRDGK